MKNGRWQAKDIPDDLVFGLYDFLHSQSAALGRTEAVGHLMSEWFPPKVVAAKLRSMEQRGLIERYGFGPLYGYIVPTRQSNQISG